MKASVREPGALSLRRAFGPGSGGIGPGRGGIGAPGAGTGGDGRPRPDRCAPYGVGRAGPQASRKRRMAMADPTVPTTRPMSTTTMLVATSCEVGIQNW
jgi:hypothetical protein